LENQLIERHNACAQLLASVLTERLGFRIQLCWRCYR